MSGPLIGIEFECGQTCVFHSRVEDEEGTESLARDVSKAPESEAAKVVVEREGEGAEPVGKKIVEPQSGGDPSLLLREEEPLHQLRLLRRPRSPDEERQQHSLATVHVPTPITTTASTTFASRP